ncbi:hypothetical protein H257_02926 [Aphanomyces astaci]|uniref:Uncharacterized protein n=1 Tax=Aphanomyces astaci TaxID=112090 RepID=W4H1D7_APHAT|nr:hypothetical protein H257_02926 [Aphanomyces astaci]ETV85049.1 hypothetical protein H257_02926 [Aphanomyces astaci]|eukprot:XP_009825067.1 hypothetical protein H257_02926 [Aphanomyces astaci]
MSWLRNVHDLTSNAYVTWKSRRPRIPLITLSKSTGVDVFETKSKYASDAPAIISDMGGGCRRHLNTTTPMYTAAAWPTPRSHVAPPGALSRFPRIHWCTPPVWPTPESQRPATGRSRWPGIAPPCTMPSSMARRSTRGCSQTRRGNSGQRTRSTWLPPSRRDAWPSIAAATQRRRGRLRWRPTGWTY